MRATSDGESTTLSREDWIKFAQRGLSNLDDETFFRKMAVYTADAVRIIEEERVRQERRARKKKKKGHRKKRSMRHHSEEASATESTSSSTPRVRSPEPRDLIDVTPKVSQSAMQVASVSPISATVSSARVEQHEAAIAEDSPRPKYPRKRMQSPPPKHKPHVPAQVVDTSSVQVAKPSATIIKSTSKKLKDGVAVDRRNGARMNLDSGKLHSEFHEATVLVTSLAHLHRSSTKKHVDAAPAKKEEHATESHAPAKVRNRAPLLTRASKAW